MNSWCEKSRVSNRTIALVKSRDLIINFVWVLWMERNWRVFDDVKGEAVEQLWERVHFLATLYFCRFKEYPVFLISLDGKAVVL